MKITLTLAILLLTSITFAASDDTCRSVGFDYYDSESDKCVVHKALEDNGKYDQSVTGPNKEMILFLRSNTAEARVVVCELEAMDNQLEKSVVALDASEGYIIDQNKQASRLDNFEIIIKATDLYWISFGDGKRYPCFLTLKESIINEYSRTEL